MKFRKKPVVIEATQWFFIDPSSAGVVRGGPFDRYAGILVGVHAQWVCDALNDALRRELAKEGEG